MPLTFKDQRFIIEMNRRRNNKKTAKNGTSGKEKINGSGRSESRTEDGDQPLSPYKFLLRGREKG